jgi:hypothetical protein
MGMLALAVALLSTPVSYGLGPGVKASYDVDVAFKGYLPIFGGQEGTVQVSMKVDVAGLSEDADKNLRASSEIESFELKFNGSKMPLGVEAVQNFFPKTTISLNPLGKVIKTDAPDVSLPVRLPGLDVKRFPEISYLPLEFPADGIEPGRVFAFKRKFGDSEIAYTVTPRSVSAEVATLDVAIAQEYTVLEDSGGNVVADERDAVRRVATTLTGSGNVAFDMKRRLAKSVEMKNVALSKVHELSGGKESERRLETQFMVRLK